MARYLAGKPARKGVYLCKWPPDISFVGADDEPLGGEPGATYHRLPGPLVVALSPVLGGLFVICFPVLIVGALAYALVRPVVARLRRHADERAYLVRGDYALAASHLDGKSAGEGDAEVEDDGAFDDLREEIARERAAEGDADEASTARRKDP